MGCHTSAAVRSPPLASWPSAHRRCGGSSPSAEAVPGDSRGRVRGFPPGDPCRAALDADSQRFVLRETWRRFHGDIQEQQHQADACSEEPCSQPPCRVVTLHAATADGELRVVCTSMAGETLAAIDFGGWPLERQTFGHLRCHLWRQLGGSSHSDAGNSPAGGKSVDRLRLVLPCGQLVGTSYDHQSARHVLLGHDGAPVEPQRATTASTPTALRRIAYNGAEAPEESQGFDVGADELCCKSLSATEHKEGTLIRAACEDSLGRPSGFAPLSIGATKAQSTPAVHTQRLVHSSLAAQAAASRKVAHGGGMLGPSRTSPKDVEEEDGSRPVEQSIPSEQLRRPRGHEASALAAVLGRAPGAAPSAQPLPWAQWSPHMADRVPLQHERERGPAFRPTARGAGTTSSLSGCWMEETSVAAPPLPPLPRIEDEGDGQDQLTERKPRSRASLCVAAAAEPRAARCAEGNVEAQQPYLAEEHRADESDMPLNPLRARQRLPRRRPVGSAVLAAKANLASLRFTASYGTAPPIPVTPPAVASTADGKATTAAAASVESSSAQDEARTSAASASNANAPNDANLSRLDAKPPRHAHRPPPMSRLAQAARVVWTTPTSHRK